MSHTLELHQILTSMWGYDQTNVDFYEVTAVTEKTVTVRQVKAESVDESTRHLTERVEPSPSDYIGEPMRRKVHDYGAGGFIMINSYTTASPWNGKPQTATHYA